MVMAQTEEHMTELALKIEENAKTVGLKVNQEKTEGTIKNARQIRVVIMLCVFVHAIHYVIRQLI